ncbi:MAG TPA: hypothetical protein VNO31_39100 [Umezawaea sp.]|jgi:hypothetical protein|nr:hypothetical protein [Umezawaea sp.]
MPHEPTQACEQDHCYWHNEDEPATGVADGVLCHECLHWFPTVQAVRECEAELRVRLGLPLKVITDDELTSCPLCGHSF